MKYTSNIITLPKEVVDAYLGALATTTDPILEEEDVAAHVLSDLLSAAAAACRKSVITKHLKSLEHAGMFKGVTCLDYPGFVWTLGSMRLYASAVFSVCLMKTLAEDLAAGTRDLESFLAYLDVVHKIELAGSVDLVLKDVSDAPRHRLSTTVGSITQANQRYMLGLTVDNMLRLFNNIKSNKEMQVDNGPLANFVDDMSILAPEPVVEL